MTIFLKLCLAHLIADFLLQFEELYQLKLKSILGHAIHASLHGVVSLILLYPYLDEPFIWIFLAVMTVVHFIQDVNKYRFISTKKWLFPLFTGDQILHVLALATIFFFPISREIRGFPDKLLLNYFYVEKEWTLYAMSFLTTTFLAAFFLHSFRISYLPYERQDPFITNLEMRHGLIERSLVTGIFIFASNPLILILSPAAGLFRLPFPLLRNAVNFFLSYGFAVAIGLLYRMWLF